MIKRDNWGHPHFVVRGENLGFTKDEQLRKHLPRVFSLIKNELEQISLRGLFFKEYSSEKFISWTFYGPLHNDLSR